MIEPATAGLQAVASHSALAYPLLFAAGVLTSAGPCVVPRYVTLAALAHAAARPRLRVAAFVAGVVTAYVLLGSAVGALGSLWRSSGFVYGALATMLAVGGLLTLLREPHACAHAPAPSAGRESVGAAFLLGGGSAFVVAPCCTPVIAGVAGLTILSGRSCEGMLLLCAFALGHALPLLAAGTLGTRIAAVLGRATASEAPAVIAGTLMLALAAYYGVLA